MQLLFSGRRANIGWIGVLRKGNGTPEKIQHKKIKVNNSIQTNGTLIDSAWAKFLGKNKFLVGLSLDGPESVHNTTRIDTKGIGSFKSVMNAVNLMDRYKVDYNILCVVNRYVAENADKVYQFYRNNGFQYIQPIPCLDPIGEKPGGHDFSVTPAQFTYFLKTFLTCGTGILKKVEQ